MAVRIEDAGFEIRDLIAWVYGSGFPKSHDISKAIDKAAGAEREVVGSKVTARALGGSNWRDGDAGGQETVPVTAPATEAAKQWQGWGTALKPAFEPITMARKPFASTVAENVLEHGTGGLNVDGCRVGTEKIKTQGGDKFPGVYGTFAACPESTHDGRWPANFIHDGSEEAAGLLGDAARFFYTAKASKADRDAGCGAMEARIPKQVMGLSDSGGERSATRNTPSRNHHPTVKPTDLMRYLCRLVTPPGGIVLDPFTGSGSTGKAAILEGFRFIGIEREAEYIEIARARIQRDAEKPRQPTLFD
jgi:site-specific DNA-methyltransferase (adenine-specific)